MTGLTDTNAVASAYGFDADQNRIAENAVRYVYDGPNVVLEIESGLPKAAYVHDRGTDQPIERIQFIAVVADGRHVYHTDALGSVWAMTDNLEVVAKAYTYEAFGKIRSETGAGLLFPNRYSYTARESFGDSLSLYYYRARVMDPNAGRFTSADPLRFVDGPNIYRYVRNQPILYRDPRGLACGSGFTDAIVPDQPFGNNFVTACTAHDTCYGTCGSTKQTCDDLFLMSMVAVCESSGTSGCLATAQIYYMAVVNLGASAYNSAQCACPAPGPSGRTIPPLDASQIVWE
jgi:RHS repeat-associated protein